MIPHAAKGCCEDGNGVCFPVCFDDQIGFSAGNENRKEGISHEPKSVGTGALNLAEQHRAFDGQVQIFECNEGGRYEKNP